MEPGGEVLGHLDVDEAPVEVTGALVPRVRRPSRAPGPVFGLRSREAEGKGENPPSPSTARAVVPSTRQIRPEHAKVRNQTPTSVHSGRRCRRPLAAAVPVASEPEVEDRGPRGPGDRGEMEQPGSARPCGQTNNLFHWRRADECVFDLNACLFELNKRLFRLNNFFCLHFIRISSESVDDT